MKFYKYHKICSVCLVLASAIGFTLSCGYDGSRKVEQNPRRGEDGDGFTPTLPTESTLPSSGGRESNGYSIYLIDGGSTFVGYYQAETSSLAKVILPGGSLLWLNKDTGEQTAPPLAAGSALDGIHCVYTSSDCSGSCYVLTGDWLDVVVLSSTGEYQMAPHGTPASAVAAFNSYVNNAAACVDVSAAPLSSGAAFVSTGVSLGELELPLLPPLTWKTQRTLPRTP